MKETALFISFMLASYTVPYTLDCPAYVPWLAVEMVYMVDMDISRSKYSEMNEPGISHSEGMSYAGMAGAFAAGVTATIFPDIQPWDGVVYFVASSITYSIWHGLHVNGQL